MKDALPDLNQLSHEQKDKLIIELWSLREKVAELEKVVGDLLARLATNSSNSSKPPSSDGFNKPQPKSLRKASGQKSGGQPKHKGHTLKQVAKPDHVIEHKLQEACSGCGDVLASSKLVAARQVFELPKINYEVTEHRVFEAICTCGQVHRSEFPIGVEAPTQYGPRVKAMAVYLSQQHMVSVHRTSEIIKDLLGLSMSQGTIQTAITQAAEGLKTQLHAIAKACLQAPVLHVDESGMRMNKALRWIHTAATTRLTWIRSHAKRGMEAIKDFGLLTQYTGILVRDAWKPYEGLSCEYALCNQHHLRELTFIEEVLKQDWATEVQDLLTWANKEVGERGVFTGCHSDLLKHGYDAILRKGEALNPVQLKANGKPGKQSKATNLLRRLREHQKEVLRFAFNPQVPFTNNTAEQTFRMAKVKQKVAGTFRTDAGLEAFCTIRSCLDTWRKQGLQIFESLALALRGAPPSLSFA